jgi:hypothetical protein
MMVGKIAIANASLFFGNTYLPSFLKNDGSLYFCGTVSFKTMVSVHPHFGISTIHLQFLAKLSLQTDHWNRDDWIKF